MCQSITTILSLGAGSDGQGPLKTEWKDLFEDYPIGFFSVWIYLPGIGKSGRSMIGAWANSCGDAVADRLPIAEIFDYSPPVAGFSAATTVLSFYLLKYSADVLRIALVTFLACGSELAAYWCRASKLT